ncbi:mitochondrial fission factor homolog A-like isoform X1 [Oncorhynchus keta]|uniref:mitochondrial fission factor homolog A-like isoform X1 n=1 Tax=Oncorhynchus keta TaxID=8018 RepID=UPI0015F823A6|nr:mitochondrial fission factor homolog A-like isoform X1 [Oncorhynchus keta]XP_052385816.1 mitochondrial fission factor homolog A-like isoform X1 [Oncorhynchus keta]
MASSGFRGDVSHVRGGRDPVFSEAINQKMRVPDRLRVGPGMGQGGEEARQGRAERPASYSMHIPERLSLTDAPDMSPRPLFTPSKHNSALPLGLAWEAQQQGAWDRDPYMREPVQSPLRRSYSDQAFGRSDPDTPTSKQALHTPTFRGGAGRPPKHSAAAANPLPMPLGLPAIPPSHLSPTTMLQAAKELGQQASQRLLQTVTQKYRFSYPEHPTTAVVEAPPVYVEPARKSAMQDSWMSPDDEGSAAAVEFIVLRRQVVKMSRRLAGLERQNAECRQTELVLFSLLLSACLLNGWLWIRR